MKLNRLLRAVIPFSLVSLFLVCFQLPTQAQGVSALTDSFSVPGAPAPGAITDGVLTRPPGANQLRLATINPQVTRIRIEQSDFLVTLTGPNSNRLFVDSPPSTLMVRSFDLTNVKSVRFTVEVSGNSRISPAVGFEWVVPGKK